MTAIDLFFRLAAILLFFVVAMQAVRRFWRNRDSENLYFALFFITLALTTTIIEWSRSDGIASGIENRIFGLSIAAHPYLLMLIIGTMQPVPRLLRVISAVGLMLTVVLIAFTESSTGAPSLSPRLLIPILYFFGTQFWGVSRFWREARANLGITRNRYYFIVAGMLLLALLMSLQLVYIFSPQTSFVEPLYTMAVVATAAAYFIGFEPPLIVRRAWQAEQVNQYQSRIIGRLINKPAERILRHLAEASQRAVGGQDAIVVSYDSAEQRLTATAHNESISIQLPFSELGEFGQLVSGSDVGPQYLRRTEIADDNIAACILDGFRAGAYFSVPVIDMPGALTLLLITLRTGTLFVEQDLILLQDFAQQARAILENNSLLAQTQVLVEELRDETGDLEEMVIEREQALRASEDELRRRLVQMSALYRELEAFSYSVSHDLRAPLRAITGFSEALIEDYGAQLPAEALDFLQRISVNSQKMGDQMNNMLKLAKLSRSEMAVEDVDITDTALRITHELRALYPSHDIIFRIDSSLVVRGDPELIKVLLTNLLGNSWKFTHGIPAASVSLTEVRIENERAFCVRDNGVGFDMAYADKLFKPFQRLHSADEFEGSGIGLAIVQRIVNRHGGRVWAESTLGAGTSFYFTLPGAERSPL